MAGRCGLEDYARRCVRCRVPKHADSSSAAELDARLSLSLPVPNEVTLRARAREERCAHVMHQRFPVVNSCQRPQIVAALPLSTLRLTRMEIESTKSENRHRQHRHAVIKKTRFFFFLFLSGFGKRFFAKNELSRKPHRRVTFRALSTTPTSLHHADFRQDSCVHPPSFHRELRVTSASPPPRRGHRPRLGRPFRDGS